MGFLLFKKDKFKFQNIRKEHESSFDVFQKRGQKVCKVFNNNLFHIEIYQSLNSKSFYKEFENGDFIVTMGTLLYKNKFGIDCLDLLFDDFRNGISDLYNDLIGSYSVLIFAKKKLYLFNDFLGLMRVYSSIENGIFSTSFIAMARSLKKITPSNQEIYEYIIRGGMYGDKTIIQEINLIPRSTVVCVNDDSLNKELEYKYKKPPFFSDFDKMLHFVSNEYLNLFDVIIKNFGTNITTALSGGYDSRLMLALLKKNGVIPHLYVYGKNSSWDVMVAKNIAKKEGFEINHINRDSYKKVRISDYTDLLESNFYFFDGLHTTGIFDNGSDIETRKIRSIEGVVQLNGAGGEVWRNFWELNDSNKRSIDFVRHKWDIYNYEPYSEKFNKNKYFKIFTKKLEKSIDFPEERIKMSSKEIEMSYPLFRYRYWQSIGNSINLLFSDTLMPLMETRFLYSSFDFPLKYKNNGIFEAALINSIDPKLASYKSAYGFNFSQKPPIKVRVRNSIKRNLPLSFKPYLRNKYSIKKDEITPYFLEFNYLSHFFDLDNMNISDFVDIKKINDPRILSRSLTLEYFFSHV